MESLKDEVIAREIKRLNETPEVMLTSRKMLYKAALQEVQKMRQSNIKPATYFLNNDIEKQILKINDELREAKKEVKRYNTSKNEQNLYRLLDELIDVMTATRTAAAIIAEDDIFNEAVKKNIKKNTDRNYYDPPYQELVHDKNYYKDDLAKKD